MNASTLMFLRGWSSNNFHKSTSIRVGIFWLQCLCIVQLNLTLLDSTRRRSGGLWVMNEVLILFGQFMNRWAFPVIFWLSHMWCFFGWQGGVACMENILEMSNIVWWSHSFSLFTSSKDSSIWLCRTSPSFPYWCSLLWQRLKRIVGQCCEGVIRDY